MTFVKRTKEGWKIDARKKIGNLIGAEIILREIMKFSNHINKQAILDVGCGDKPYESILKEHAELYVGTDIPGSYHDATKDDVFSSADCLPFFDNQFDIVFCTEVVEHIPDVSGAFKEFYRVCKSNGYLFLTSPFFHEIHEAPYDFYRFTRYGLEYLAETSGFKIISIKSIGEMLAVTIVISIRLLRKVSRAIDKILKVDLIRNLILNPIFFISSYIPQKLYLKLYFYGSSKPNSLINHLFTKLSSACLGYVLIAQKATEGNNKIKD